MSFVIIKWPFWHHPGNVSAVKSLCDINRDTAFFGLLLLGCISSHPFTFDLFVSSYLKWVSYGPHIHWSGFDFLFNSIWPSGISLVGLNQRLTVYGPQQTRLCFAFVNKVLLAQSQAQCFIVMAAVVLQGLSVLTHNLDSLRLVVLVVAGINVALGLASVPPLPALLVF